MNTNPDNKPSLPLTRDLPLVYALSLIIAILMAAASIAGLLYPAVIYPTEELLQAFLPNDVSTLFIGLPMLLGSMWFTRRGALIGLLFWPGALFYAVYNYIVYVLAMPINAAFYMQLALVALSVFALIVLLVSIDGKAVKQGLTGAVPARLSGGILAGLGLLFSVRALIVLIGALTGQAPIAETEFAVNISDLIISPSWVICGVLLWRRAAFGYVTGLGLLFQASMLFIGLIIILILLPLMTSAPFMLFDVLVVFVMGMVSFVPLALFARGVASGRNSMEG